MSTRSFQPGDAWRITRTLCNSSGVPTNADTVSAPSAPAPTTSGTGGTIAANTYYFVVTYTTLVGETTASTQGSVTTTGTTSTITVPSPSSATGATGWKCYGGTTNGSAWVLQGGTNAIGTNLTLTAPLATGTAAPPGTNTAEIVTGTAFHNGAVDSSVTFAITTPATGVYSFAATIPSGYAFLDTFEVQANATMGGTSYGDTIDSVLLAGYFTNKLTQTGPSTVNAQIGTSTAITFNGAYPEVDAVQIANVAPTTYDGVAQGPGTGNNQIQLAAAETKNPLNRLISLVGATGIGQQAYCIAWTSATKMATIYCPQGTAGAWVTNPDSTTQYTVGDLMPAIDGSGNARVQGPFKINTAAGYSIRMVSSSDHISAYTGAASTVTVTRTIAGGASAPIAGSLTQIGSTNEYYLSGTAADFNGTEIHFAFTATGADPVYVTIPTTP